LPTDPAAYTWVKNFDTSAGKKSIVGLTGKEEDMYFVCTEGGDTDIDGWQYSKSFAFSGHFVPEKSSYHFVRRRVLRMTSIRKRELFQEVVNGDEKAAGNALMPGQTLKQRTRKAEGHYTLQLNMANYTC
jgi:hypothetical protein